MAPEDRLPPELLTIACRSGQEIGWRRDDLLRVLVAAAELGLASLGGQVQIVLPGGTCELYWQNYDPAPRQPGEPWPAYARRSCNDTAQALARLPANADLVAAGVATFPFLEEQTAVGVDLERHLCFLCYFAIEGSPHLAA